VLLFSDWRQDSQSFTVLLLGNENHFVTKQELCFSLLQALAAGPRMFFPGTYTLTPI